jgi:NAD(P)H dehydrogenase (quinone)
MLRRNILGFVGVHLIRTTIYGSIEEAGDERRRRWLKEIEALGREAA